MHPTWEATNKTVKTDNISFPCALWKTETGRTVTTSLNTTCVIRLRTCTCLLSILIIETKGPIGDTFSVTCQEPQAALLKPSPSRKMHPRKVCIRRKTKERDFRDFKSPKSFCKREFKPNSKSSGFREWWPSYSGHDLNDLNDFIATSLVLL